MFDIKNVVNSRRNLIQKPIVCLKKLGGSVNTCHDQNPTKLILLMKKFSMYITKFFIRIT